jgi:competence protein ComGC
MEQQMSRWSQQLTLIIILVVLVVILVVIILILNHNLLSLSKRSCQVPYLQIINIIGCTAVHENG